MAKSSLKLPMTKSVATKTFDGGASKAKRKQLRPEERRADAFSFYSSRQNLMDALLGPSEEGENRPPAVIRQADHEADPAQDAAPRKGQDERKTRVSFEVHPHLIMLQLLEEI